MRALPTQQLEDPTHAEVRERVDRVLARDEFDWDQQSLLERIGSWLAEHIDLPSLPGAWEGLELLLLAPLFAALVWLLLRLRRHLRRLRVGPEQELADDADRVAQRVAELLETARLARAAGDLRRALRHYFFALVVGLGRRGGLEYRDTWTNRELLERGHPSAEVAALLTPLVSDLDAKGYGGAATSEADVAYLEDLCTRWLSGSGGAR